jgi:oligopeptide transport system substrate-binding protein
MNRTKKLLALTLALALCLGLLAGCGGGGQTTPTPSGDGDPSTQEATFRRLYGSEVSTMNYLTTNTILEQTVGANVIDCLVEYDQYGNIQPALATQWSTNDDKTVYTFTLRQGVKWVDHTGAEVAELTAHDFVTAAAYVLDANNASGTAASYFGVVANAEAYFNYTSYLITSENGTKTTDAEGNAIEPVEEISFDAVGVKALDNYTLEYTLEKPVPYFLSGLTYVCFMPAYGPFLEEQGVNFGAATDPSTMLYCGPYILSEFSPQQTHVYTKNEAYWDKDKVYIDKIVETYNSQYNTVGPQMIKTGELDDADIGADILDSWLLDPSTADLVSKYRPKVDYSYFYCFNFNPTFDAQYEPDNWKLAVNNENFRQALMAALDRVRELSVLDPNDPASLAINSITPPGFTNADGKDYTQYGDLAAIMARDSFDEAKAAQYRDAARAELAAAGCTFPVKVLVRYNPATVDWDKECAVVEQQMEGLLGADFIDIITVAGPESNFLTEVRRSGDYAFMKCGWGADFADPQTWTDPFYGDYKYAFLTEAMEAGDPVAPTVAEYRALVEEAIAETSDMARRYELFAAAEAYLIEHALAIPFSTNQTTYVATKLNMYEAAYAPFGVSNVRYHYKGMHLQDNFVSMEQYEANLADWQAARGG